MASPDEVKRQRCEDVIAVKPLTWYAAVLRQVLSNGDLDEGLHWSAQPGVDTGCMIFHSSKEMAGEHCKKIEKEEHWHGGSCQLAMLEMKLHPSCQKDLVQRSVMRLVTEKDGEKTMRWHDVLRSSMRSDGWGASVARERFEVREVEWEGGMPTVAVSATRPTVADLGLHPHSRRLYGIILSEFSDHLNKPNGLHWGMQPGGWGSFSLVADRERCKEKYHYYQKQQRGSDNQPALCLLTITVKSKEAWQFLLDEELLVEKSQKYYLKMPVSSTKYWRDENQKYHVCYEAKITFEEVN